jgi:N-methylhydantoinase A/oxoprolinase/acetone carboxylase beta subunit
MDVMTSYFEEDRPTATPLYDRDAAVGQEVAGPAIIADAWSTTVVAPWQTAQVHPTGAIVLS